MENHNSVQEVQKWTLNRSAFLPQTGAGTTGTSPTWFADSQSIVFSWALWAAADSVMHFPPQKKNKTYPRTRMHYVYLCHARLSPSLVNDCGMNSCQWVLSTALVNDDRTSDALTLDNDSCRRLLPATRENEHDMTWHDTTRHDTTWHDMTWLDRKRDGTRKDEPTRRKEIETRRDATQRDMTWHYMTRHDVTCHDMTQHNDITWYDVTWRDVTGHDMARRLDFTRDVRRRTIATQQVGDSCQRLASTTREKTNQRDTTSQRLLPLANSFWSPLDSLALFIKVRIRN